MQMFRAILFQIWATVVAVATAGGFAGFHGAVSAGLGGLVCVLPNFLFALRLSRVARRPGASYPANFFLGEFIKITVTIGLVLAVQAGFLAFWKKS